MKITLEFAEKELAEYIDGGGNCSQMLRRKRISEAVRILLRSGDYASVDRYCLKAFNRCITLPPDVSKIRKANIEGTYAAVHTSWYEFMEGIGEHSCAWNCKSLKDRGSHYVTFADLPCPMHLMAVSDLPEVENTYIFISGTNGIGEPVRSEIDGKVRYGEQLPLNGPGVRVVTRDRYENITKVQKDPTDGIVRLYGWLPENEAKEAGLASSMYMVGYYMPWETQPSYTRYELCHANCKCGTDVTIQAKRQWVPLVHPDQILPISNLDALIDMLLGLSQRKKGDMTKRDQYFDRAKSAMEEELEETRGSEMEIDASFYQPSDIERSGYGYSYGYGQYY